MGDHYKRFNTNKPLKVGECDGNTCYKPTSKELKSHDRKNNCWIGINGTIYNITKYRQALKIKLDNKKKTAEEEYNNNKNIILTDYNLEYNRDYNTCNINSDISSSNICKFQLSSNNNNVEGSQINNLCGQSEEDMNIRKELLNNCKKYEMSKFFDIKNYKLNLLCGNHYNNINEKNYFFPEVDHSKFVIGELKYYNLYKLLIILVNISTIASIFYILKYKMDNLYINYVLLVLIIYIFYFVYNFIQVYFDRHNKHTKIQNQIYKNSVNEVNDNSFSIEKVKQILIELQQRLMAKILLVVLIVLIVIYCSFNDIKNITIIVTIVSIIFMYLFYLALKNRLYRDYKPQFRRPS